MSPEHLPQKNENDRAIVNSVIEDLTKLKAKIPLIKINTKSFAHLAGPIDTLSNKISNHLDSAGDLSHLDVRIFTHKIKSKGTQDITGIDPIITTLLSDSAVKDKTSIPGADIFPTKYSGLFIKRSINPKKVVHYNLVGIKHVINPINYK